MVCDRDLSLTPEPASIGYAKSNVARFWSIGETVAPQSFSPAPSRFPISDDHDALSEAGIPSFLVIDFDYDPWFNTTKDTALRNIAHRRRCPGNRAPGVFVSGASSARCQA
jgi:hypothetical protein